MKALIFGLISFKPFLGGFANTANTQDDINKINQLIDAHPSDFQGSLSTIKDSLNTAELNIQWNELHLQNVVFWLENKYSPIPDTTTEDPNTSPSPDPNPDTTTEDPNNSSSPDPIPDTTTENPNTSSSPDPNPDTTTEDPDNSSSKIFRFSTGFLILLSIAILIL